MKRIIFLTILIWGICAANAQYPRASLWTSAINGFAAQDAVSGAPKDVVLFTGSSTFTMWTGLQTDFPNSKVLNRAFGGSMMTDLIYYFGQVVAPYNPRQVVLYEGDNDLHETTKTPEGFMDDVIAMTRLINIYFPNAEILLVSIKPSPSRTASFAKYEAANLLMKNYADKFQYMKYVDTWNPMLKQDGTPETSYFGPDMLHMNASGYVLWKSILEPYLLTGSYEVPDKSVFTESSHAYYHDFSWSAVTAPSVFTTVQSGKISTDSTFYRNGKTSLKLHYQGMEGGNWMACVAGPDWVGYDISGSKELELWVYSDAVVETADMPYIYLESRTGTVTGKLLLSAYIPQIPAGEWKKVIVPIADWKALSPSFSYDNVKTIFFSQLNVNASPVKIYIDDVTFLGKGTVTPPDGVGDILIDFGSGAAGFPTPGNWNNIHDHQAANLTLIDDEGNDTGITLKITDPFYNGFNTNGASTVTGDAAIFAGTATIDNFFGHTVDWAATPANPLGIFTLSGLEPSKYYSFYIFASRTGVTDNREAKYTITAKDGDVSATLNSSNNTTEIAKILNVQSNAQGEITFKTEVGENNNNATKFFYLGALKIIKTDAPNAVRQAPAPSKLNVIYTDGVLRLNDDYTGKVRILDAVGKTIFSGQSLFGLMALRLEQGMYIVNTNIGNAKLKVQ